MPRSVLLLCNAFLFCFSTDPGPPTSQDALKNAINYGELKAEERESHPSTLDAEKGVGLLYELYRREVLYTIWVEGNAVVFESWEAR